MNYKQYGCALLVLASMAALVVVPGLLQQRTLLSSEDKAREFHRTFCRVSAGCRLDIHDGTIELFIEPYTMPVLQPLQIDVKIVGVKPESVSMEFIGRDMAMGLMPHNLELLEHSTNFWFYRGEAMITFCPVDRNMVWLARVVVESDQLIRTMVFELENQ
ncbi:hypothetical protein [Endozoicomonas montiporae]|nr:hypothetical protein [Endozoicomonas montiporae]